MGCQAPRRNHRYTLAPMTIRSDAPLAPPTARPDTGWSWATHVRTAAGVLAARLLYLLRYGWDIGWMNLGYLEHARTIALGGHEAIEEQPLTYFALVAAHGLGFGARVANEVVYLVAHLLLAMGVVGLGQFVWPAASARRRAALAAAVALTPLLACESGRNNLGASLAAGLAASALALAAAAATAARVRPDVAARLVLAAVLAALASGGRYEALATCAAGAGLLALLGSGLPTELARATSARATPLAKLGATALAAGVAVGAVAVVAIRRALAGGAAVTSTYGLYTFYDGLPLLMFPHLPGTEYGRYRASVRFFGTFDENHGSVLQALLHHPGFALLRFVAKPVDHLAVLLWIYGLTPVGVGLAALGLGGILKRHPLEQRRPWLLGAYLLPLGMLFVPQQNPAYYLSIAAPMLLAIARGAYRLGAALGPRKGRILAGVTVLAAIALVGAAGKRTVSNSRALNEAAAYLETRCRAGCLTNALPQSIASQVWAVTDAGAPFPPRIHRSEQAILEGLRLADTGAYDYCARVDRARASGFAGPVLYVDPRIRTFTAFDPDFDPTVRFQGSIDRSDLVEERRFSSGPDETIIYNLPVDRPCRHTASSTK